MKFSVKFKRGNGTCVVESSDIESAKKEALAYYRKNSLMVDYLTANEVVDSIEPLSE